MDTLTINMSLDEVDNINIEFKGNSVMKIETAGDIDFTEFVKELTFLINNENILVLNKFECEEEKLTLIQQTIEEICNSFNESIDSENEDSEEEVPF